MTEFGDLDLPDKMEILIALGEAVRITADSLDLDGFRFVLVAVPGSARADCIASCSPDAAIAAMREAADALEERIMLERRR